MKNLRAIGSCPDRTEVTTMHNYVHNLLWTKSGLSVSGSSLLKWYVFYKYIPCKHDEIFFSKVNVYRKDCHEESRVQVDHRQPLFQPQHQGPAPEPRTSAAAASDDRRRCLSRHHNQSLDVVRWTWLTIKTDQWFSQRLVYMRGILEVNKILYTYPATAYKAELAHTWVRRLLCSSFIH